jgi:hypothetical protein
MWVVRQQERLFDSLRLVRDATRGGRRLGSERLTTGRDGMPSSLYKKIDECREGASTHELAVHAAQHAEAVA